MNEPTNFKEHYERPSLVEFLRNALSADGLGERQLTSKDLAPLDQFHSRGLAATVELAHALPIGADTRVVDIGSGLGGPSRYLAETYGCTVQGVDLSRSFVDAANFLAERSGLADKVRYQHGDALALPFPTGSFDVAWTQHVAMNIGDRASFYAEAFRVLRSGGRFAIFDVVADSGGPLHFPVPWAQAPETSFLVTADEMRQEMSAQGFRVSSWVDSTEAAISWFREREQGPSSQPPAFELQAVMGPQFNVSTGNLRRNLSEGRAALIQAIYEKP